MTVYQDIDASRATGIYQASTSVVTIDNPDGAASESIRALRTQLVTAGGLDTLSAVAVCGPSAEVGSTFMAVNLAVAMSQIGSRVLLIDADLREPEVHELLIPPGSPQGLADWLTSAASLEEVINPNIIPNLSILYAGTTASSSPELLTNGRFDELIQICSRDYDFTVVDTPAANRFADSRYIASVVGAALLIARKDVTVLSDLKVLTRELEQNGARVVGVVLNEH